MVIFPKMKISQNLIKNEQFSDIYNLILKKFSLNYQRLINKYRDKFQAHNNNNNKYLAATG
jgi:hypothetical protein